METEETQPYLPTAKAARLYYAWTKTDGDTVTKMRSLTRVDTSTVGDGSDMWSLFISELAAPDATFDRDLPIMREIMQSAKLDPEFMRRRGIERLKESRDAFARAQDQRMREHQQYMNQQQEHFNRFEDQMRAQSKARHDANSDFIEMIGGYSTVVNTQTGQTGSVNYYNVNGIVNGLNQGNPGLYQYIPLRNQR